MLPRTLATKTYMCTDQRLSQSLELCVSATCTIKEALSRFCLKELIGVFLMLIATKYITERSCNLPLRNRTNTISVTAIVGVSLALLAVMLRLLSRIKSRKPGMDDWAMIIAMVRTPMLEITPGNDLLCRDLSYRSLRWLLFVRQVESLNLRSQ